VIVVVPLHAAAHVTVPVAAPIVLPPAMLAASRLYTIAEELFVAVVVRVTGTDPWHIVDVAGANAAIVTVGVIVTT
jgi:hypothetical protein